MCLDPVVVSLSANLLHGSLACRPGQQKPVWWAAGGDCAGGQELPGTATPAQASARAASVFPNGSSCLQQLQRQLMVCTAFIAAGWRAAEKGPLHFLLRGLWKNFLQTARSTDTGCSERRRLKKCDQSPSFPKCPCCPGSHFQNRCTPWASAGLRQNGRRWELVGTLHPSLNVLSLESSWETPREKWRAMPGLSGQDAASAGSCCILPGASQHHEKQCHWGTCPLSPLSPLPWEGAATAKWNLACTERERWPLKGKNYMANSLCLWLQSWNCRNHLSHWDWTRYHV